MRVELYRTRNCTEGQQVALWLWRAGVPHGDRDLSDPAVSADLRKRTRIGISPVVLVDGRAVWGTAREQIRRLRGLGIG
ncbi:MAG: hypothetical protein Q27BPR15_01855 [Rhodobacter sp. CACIA14H1]|nr:MAG: hypothetical protein Q27BPR15_01855 [Rhodobacter sp. CACIA14H1]